MIMEVKILSSKLIKPSTPTPNDLRYFHIAFTDEMSPTMNVPLILYYIKNSSIAADDTVSFNQLLENSLAQILPQFYPLSGRYIKEKRLIDCCDQGVKFLEARVDCHLHQILGQGMKDVKPEQLNDLLPCPIGEADEAIDPLLSIQVNMFECGGMAIGVCISHRIADASTLSTFLLAWSNIACSTLNKDCRENNTIRPIFNSPQFFPGRNLPKLELGIPRTMDNSDVRDGPKIVTRRFLFDGKAISEIRSRMMINCDDGTFKHQFTRVQLISGLILRALLEIDQSNYGRSRAALVLQTVNFRDKTSPQIPKHSCGNYCIFAVAQCNPEQTRNMGFQESVNLVGNAIRETVDNCSKILNSGENGHMAVINPFKEVTELLYKSSDLNAILLNSWCRFPYYEADFGWGKPVWLSLVSIPAGNSVVLIDSNDGDAVEAWVNLEEKDMFKFQQDQDIKTFTT
ncbi:hypothetical protein ACH5RR_002076 [Cinchona calisaya]|uniref:Uncharacterized protein n=1 Tax=Cinchona calisaya TaxID=153742 RepID=A0ABD3B582_9GENT